MTWEQQVLMVHFVLKSVKDDTIGYFDLRQEELIDRYLQFAQELDCFMESNIFQYLNFMRDQSRETDPKVVEEQLDHLFDLFFFHLKENDELREYKKDYL